MKNLDKVGIIGDALAPRFNEAQANQMRLLSEKLNIPVLTCNNIGIVPFRKMGRYLIINGYFLREGTAKPVLSPLNGAFLYLFLKIFESRHDTLILSGGINSGFIRHLRLEKYLLVVNSLPFSKDSREAREFSLKFAPRLRGIIAQSRRIRDKFLDMGIKPVTVHLVYPWIDLNRFKPTRPPNLNEFNILFASAPNTEIAGENVFEDKGIPLLLEAFQEFAKEHKALLRLLWRGHCNEALWSRIRELRLEDKVEVVDEVADTTRFITESHIMVIPFLNTRRSPEIPLSAVESLASGRPVVATDVVEISRIVTDYNCGCTSKATKHELALALKKIKMNYPLYQVNCRRTAEELFALETKIFEEQYCE